MPVIRSIYTTVPGHEIRQDDAAGLTRRLFKEKFKDIERLLRVFDNGDIQTRHVTMPLDWYGESHPFGERNDLYIEHAIRLGSEAMTGCLENPHYLGRPVDFAEIDAVFYISSSGISTPSIEARIMNRLPFRDDVKRIPVWGLGCAGGASGISRAFDYCKAYPDHKVLVLCVELCSLTFQSEDYTKSNLVGASLFADGVACALVTGDEADIPSTVPMPHVNATVSKTMPDSEDVMGWDVDDAGLHVIFSKSIPAIITEWLGPFVHEFLDSNGVGVGDIGHFVAHPGGKKVLVAYEDALGFDRGKTDISREVLRQYGNMSSPTVLFVLEQFMKKQPGAGETGLMAALGPGFSGELLLLEWR
ncbi:type III polyketide synthase [Edaphobacillus lindanitolerans]|uniref:15-methylpalmitoyl-4-hydroxy-2-pyrone synthase n=1 Tax=Edaphobacillus lindanitolerans TaxID=550447 RepID=A0A1U7PQF7_9BACI|nr:3-oxoacyl-[acyl-carrier-protein] synthase III C-terminal domain-containing protein [Edaphobacillus lindanitolerans]SIT85611.1 15-methylpalmitoyl-4-hydroxy-2-pyrone synthase [Edaphobacillus lindanitolerans]